MGDTTNKHLAKSRSKSMLREYAEAIVIAVLLALFIRTFVVQAFKIPSGSMEPTLLVGDHILVNKFIYGIKIPFTDKTLIHISTPKRGDIIVFAYPRNPSVDFIKRVIGLPGDRIRIVNKHVYVNGKLLHEPYVVHRDKRILPASLSPRDNMPTVVVPPHELFVMGDNRDESYDSRFWGFVPMGNLKGEAFMIYWSWNSHGKWTLNPNKGFIRWNRIGKLLY